ncbi:hypothetical protein F4814DRAFT_457039 [Daldinia grandis]|nr:hypothetical protein F4814DRAFT_457039 [Daldinia grandis]
MARKRTLSPEDGDRTDYKRIRTESNTNASDDRRNKAINMALSRANIGKKYSWMNRDTGTLEKPKSPVYKTAEEEEEEEGLIDCPGSPESYTASATPLAVANDDPIQPSIESSFETAIDGYNGKLAEMERELAEDYLTKSKPDSGTSESPIIIPSREPSPVNDTPSKEATPTTNITDPEKPALMTPPKTDDEEKLEQQEPPEEPVQEEREPVVQEPEEDTAAAEDAEREDLFAMIDYICQFVS